LGASFKDFESDLPTWQEKVETVLRQLYWFSARLHLESWMGSFRFEWLPEDDAVERMPAERPVPVSHWRFESDYPFGRGRTFCGERGKKRREEERKDRHCNLDEVQNRANTRRR
jgi:hypothetical protein